MVWINHRPPQCYWLTLRHRRFSRPGSISTHAQISRHQMHSEKVLMHKAADKLIKKAADCFDVAEAQHHVAEKQHEIASRQHCSADALEANANKLDGIGRALEADAAEIYGSM